LAVLLVSLIGVQQRPGRRTLTRWDLQSERALPAHPSRSQDKQRHCGHGEVGRIHSHVQRNKFALPGTGLSRAFVSSFAERLAAWRDYAQISNRFNPPTLVAGLDDFAV